MIKELSQPIVADFILKHENEEVTKLVLAQKQFENIPVQLAVAQIQSRKKAKSKLPEWYAARGVLFPHGLSLEQCSSEATAVFKSRLVSGKSLVDLTGGTGVDTYYLSKNFKTTHYVERSAELCDLARYNFEHIFAPISVHNSSAESHLSQLEEKVDCIYLDPDRRDTANRKMVGIADCSPNVQELQDTLVSKAKTVLIKYSPLLDISEILRSLKNVSDIYVVSVANECKEILVKLDGSHQSECILHTVNLLKESVQTFEFKLTEEKNALLEYAEPMSFLYEPNASILKAGAFKCVAQKFGINKLHPNSHLYTSTELVKEFPGRVFKILGEENPSLKKWSKHLPDGKANITVRNFPLTVDQIRKKTKIKDGGEFYLFATTIAGGKPTLIICEKVGL